MPHPEHFTGLLADNRPAALREKDYSSVELAQAAGAIAWVKKSEDQLRRYQIWNQWASSACVGFSFAKMVAIEIYRITGVWVDLSPAFIYQLRSNKNIGDGLGMFSHDAANIVKDKGTTIDALMPSANLPTLNEIQINSIPRNRVSDAIALAVADAVESYLYLPKSMDAVAGIIDQQKAVSFTLFANFDEYNTEVPIVKAQSLTYGDAPIRHRVTFTERNLDDTLGKVLIMDDSWGLGNGKGGRRKITEDFFYKRISEPLYLDSFTLNPQSGGKPKVHLTVPLEFIPLDANKEISDLVKNAKQLTDVKKVQDVLRYEGFYPADKASTGYYGAVTATGVDKYQRKYGVATPAELDALQGKRVGAKTITDINTRYA